MSSWPNLLQSPGVPSHTQVREPQSAMRRQEQPQVQGLWSPHSAMEAMNQSGQPRKSGKRGPMQPAPLTSGGLALEEVTCRGWGPHLQYSFLIKQPSCQVSIAHCGDLNTLHRRLFLASHCTLRPSHLSVGGNVRRLEIVGQLDV